MLSKSRIQQHRRVEISNILYVEVSVIIGRLNVLDLIMKVKPHTILGGFLRVAKQIC
jgi:hypothetical protein